MASGSKGLADQTCTACRPGAPKVNEESLQQFLDEEPGWEHIQQQGIPALERVFRFKHYLQAADFCYQVANLAEGQDHHPVIKLEWGKVTVTWWTHAIQDLHQNDLIMAAKTSRLYQDGFQG